MIFYVTYVNYLHYVKVDGAKNRTLLACDKYRTLLACDKYIYINLQSEKNEENAEIFTSNQFSVDDSTYQCSSVNLQKCTKIEKKS